MIRIIYRNGVMLPIGPVPESWSDDSEHVLEELPGDERPADSVEDWYREIRQWESRLLTAEESVELQQALDEADAIAKGIVRREMGLE